MPEATFAPGATAHRIDVDPRKFEIAAAEWKTNPTTGLLGDILSYSIDGALRPQIIHLLRTDQSNRCAYTPTQAHLIAQLLSEEDDSERDSTELRHSLEICNPIIRHEVANLRRILRASPANPLALLDLAQFQLSFGQTRRAERTLRSALYLSPNNRIVLRTLSRLYVHERKFDQAHSLISNHELTRIDPWLMASEIALANIAEAPSKFAKKGSAFTKERRAGNSHISELAGALGGIELEAGNLKRARDLFRLALLAPNDNVVAQAITHQDMLGFDLTAPSQRQAIMSAHEAQTLLAWEALECGNAETHGLAWHHEEPFSSRPIQVLTTIYAAQRNYASAETLARRGLIADPKDPGLLSNLAYALASAGQLDPASKILHRLVALGTPRYRGIALATAGLMEMKRGEWAAGDEFYEAAMHTFRLIKDPRIEALCAAYHARSATDSYHPNQEAIVTRAQSLIKRSPSTDASIVLKLIGTSPSPAPTPGGDRRLSQWLYDAKSESLVQIHRVTQPGDPILIAKS